MENGVDIKMIIEELKAADKSGVVCIDCGTVPYREALELQSQLQLARIDDAVPDTVLVLEHPPVITLGVRKEHNRLLDSTESLMSRGIDVVSIQRGGGSTAHNPGQLIVYPIVKLVSRGLRVVPYVRFLEELCIELLHQYGIDAERRNRYPGVWIGSKKIASVGVQITRNVTMHGIAMNLNNDLSIFDAIVPCGIDGVEMTSVYKECGIKADMPGAKEFVIRYSEDFFDGKSERGNT